MERRLATIISTLRYARKYSGNVVVVKCGWDVIADTEAVEAVAEDLARLRHQAGIRVILVHGAGGAIDTMLSRRQIPSAFVGGQRVTSPKVLRVVHAVAAKTSRKLVKVIGHHGGLAISMLDYTGNHWLHAVRRVNAVAASGAQVDLGLVGDVAGVDREALLAVLDNGVIPVVAPLGRSSSRRYLNINADIAAVGIAGALQAKRLVYLSNVAGVHGPDGVVTRAKRQQLTTWIADGIIHGGMVPKVEACLAALDAGVTWVTITDGRQPHALLFELLTERGSGTLIED